MIDGKEVDTYDKSDWDAGNFMMMRMTGYAKILIQGTGPTVTLI
jgi:hypothetical protein